jgi:hypothetical protein
MKRNRTISRRLMQRRTELENRKRRKQQPSEQRARIIRHQSEGVGASVGTFGALGQWVARVFGGR